MEKLVRRTRTSNTRVRYQRLEAILEGLQGKGLRLHAASRFPRYLAKIREYVERQRNIADYGDDELRELSTALCECDELLDSLELLQAEPMTEGLMPTLQKVVTGPLLPVAGIADAARAAQFELVTAAACRNAGTFPIIEEPDIRVRVERRTIAIAAKRLLSASSMEKRIREARDQIRGAAEKDDSQIGIIAIDLTPAIGLDSRTLRVSDRSDLESLFHATGEEVSRLGGRVGELASKYQRVRAVAAYTRFTAVLHAEGRFGSVRPWHCGPVPAGAPTASALRRFLLRWGSLPSGTEA
jgi:hypothetical protein